MPKRRRALNNWQAPYIQSLVQLANTQSKRTLAFWAIGYSRAVMLPLYLQHYPGDTRPERALDAAVRWLDGEIKFPDARVFILDCHAAAREAEPTPSAQAAARAIGQSASTIHSARHAIGLAFYGALAVAYDELGLDASWEELEASAAREVGRMEDALHIVAVPDEPNPARIIPTVP